MTEQFEPSELNLYNGRRNLLKVATGYPMRSDKVERLRKAAEILNQIKGSNYFVVETMESDEHTASDQPGVEQTRVVGEWLNEKYPNLSELRDVERAIAAGLVSE